MLRTATAAGGSTGASREGEGGNKWGRNTTMEGKGGHAESGGHAYLIWRPGCCIHGGVSPPHLYNILDPRMEKDPPARNS